MSATATIVSDSTNDAKVIDGIAPAATSKPLTPAQVKAAKVKAAAKVKEDAAKVKAQAAKEKSDAKAYDAAVRAAKAAAGAVNKGSWIIGDNALAVSAIYGQKIVQQFADDIGLAYKTVLYVRKVAEVYAVADRSDLNLFTVHAEFSREDDRAELVKSQVWTVKAARDLVASRKPAEEIVGDGDGDGEGNGADGELSIAEQIEKAELNVTRLEGELLVARTHLAQLKAKAPAPAAPVKHNERGIPEHTASNPHAACGTCRKNGLAPAAPRNARKPAAALAS